MCVCVCVCVCMYVCVTAKSQSYRSDFKIDFVYYLNRALNSSTMIYDRSQSCKKQSYSLETNAIKSFFLIINLFSSD